MRFTVFFINMLLLIYIGQVSADNSALFKVQENQLAQFKLQQEQALAYFELQQQVQQELVEYQLVQAQLQQLQLVIQQQQLSYSNKIQIVQQQQPVVHQSAETTNNDLAILNRARQNRGLPVYDHDPDLTAIANERAGRQARSRWMRHVSGKPNNVAEGVSRNGSRRQGNPIASACLSMSRNYRTAGASCVKGRDGRTYCSLILKR